MTDTKTDLGSRSLEVATYRSLGLEVTADPTVSVSSTHRTIHYTDGEGNASIAIIEHKAYTLAKYRELYGPSVTLKYISVGDVVKPAELTD